MICTMLGFRPESSTEQNLHHGEQLLAQCAHGSVCQIHNWWQDPNMYYAFESKKGAKWFAEHGGPTNFMKLVGAHAKELTPPPTKSPFKVDPICHSCMHPFDSFTKPIPLKIYRCMCGTKIVHPSCFMPLQCPICRITACVFRRDQSILSCI